MLICLANFSCFFTHVFYTLVKLSAVCLVTKLLLLEYHFALDRTMIFTVE
jgi:hypothetical protein